jgi:subtilisin family serine protease
MRHRVLGALLSALTVTIAGAIPASVASAVPASVASAIPADVASAAAVPTQVGQGDRQRLTARTVTLITGDRVTSYGAGRLTVAPRKGVAFLSYKNRKHQYVIPTDAVALLRADRLDPRLFDVTGLLEAGYDKRDHLPLIVSGSSNAKGLAAKRPLAAVGGYATKVNEDKLATTWSVTRGSLTRGKVWLDALRKPTLDVSVPQIGAPAAWAAGFDGTGVKVAVLDTGIDASHPDLAGAVTAEKNFAAEAEDGLDHVGHGTHVASTIAGTGAGSAGKYRGVAPGAKLLDGKVCVMSGCAESWILSGMQWAAESGAKVVNMSLGGTDTAGIDPIEQAVNDLTAKYGVLFVVAAGNSGAYEPVSSPASADAALAVGAVTKTGELADFSSRGPRIGDHAVKPEISAPGVDITAARGKDSDGGPPDQLYVSYSGTSMATPHVTGAAAILTQVHPQWSPEQRKAALMASAKPNPAISVFAQGAGRVDLARAYAQAITTTPASVGFGLQEYPHDDDPLLTRGIVYHNPTGRPVTLRLALTTTAPAGMFALGASSVTIPAGGNASVTLTANTRVGGNQTGDFGGQVTATAAGVSVQTPFGVVRDVAKAKVHVTAMDRTGQPGSNTLTVLLNPETLAAYWTWESDATLTVIPGTYLAFSFVPDRQQSINLLVYPTLAITGDRELAMDGRLARGFDVTVPDQGAAPVGALFDVQFGNVGISATVMGADFGSLYSAHLGPKNAPALLSMALGLFARPDGSGGFTGSPYYYQTGWYSQGEVFDGLVRHLRERDLATVRAQYGFNAVGSKGTRTNFGVAPGSFAGWGFGLSAALPAMRTEYFAGTLAWQPMFSEWLPPGTDGPPLVIVSGPTTTYAACCRYAERWNNAVFGPNLVSPDAAFPSVLRAGDDIIAFPVLYADASGRQGFADYQAGRGALYRNGRLVAENPYPGGVFTVPPGAAQYRLEVRAEQVAALRLSTTVESVWTFNSAHLDKAAPLPVIGLGIAASLNERNTATAGSFAVTPIIVSQQQGSGAGQVTHLAVDVSYDDGATWQKAHVVHALGKWLLALKHPDKAGFVSLRAQATDSAGNTVQQTVIRAYELR